MAAKNLSKTLLVTGPAIGGAMTLLVRRNKKPQRPNGSIGHPLSPPSPRQARADSQAPETGRHRVRRSEGPPPADFHGAPPQDDTVGQGGTYPPKILGLVEDHVTARPHPPLHKPTSGDDFDAFGADQFGVAFLSRATESGSDDLDDEDYAGLTEVANAEEALISEASTNAASVPNDDAEIFRDGPFADDRWMDHDTEDGEDSLDDLPGVSRR